MRATITLAMLALAACAHPSDPLPLGDSSSDCGTCHAAQHDAFATSPHASSSRSPVLAAMLPRVESAWGAAARARCESCHAPSHASLERDVTCITCHAAIGNRAERDGLLVVDPRPGLAGPFADAEPTGAHASRPSTILASPSLCATCHEVTGPELFVEPTMSEHVASPAFADGEHCADCHMPALDDAPIAVTSDRSRARRDHSFVGVDPPWGASPAEAALAAERTRALLASALALRARIEGDVVIIELENIARGHDVPTGLASMRELGVDVTWISRASAPVTVRAIELGDRPMRGELPVALPTDADHIEHRRLAAGATRIARLPLPSDVIAVEVELSARAFRADALEALGLADRLDEVPVHALASIHLAAE